MNEIKTYTLHQVEEILHLSRRTLYRYIKENKLPAVKIGSEWRITEAALAELLTPTKTN